MHRREFMALGAAGAVGLVARARGWQAPQNAAPDLVVVNARVYTMEPSSPRAEAFAISGGRFVSVGSNAAMRSLAGRSTQTIDAKQMTVVPGFADCHNHAPGDVLLYEVLVGNPFEVEFVPIRSIVEKLRAKARETPPGTWV